MTLSHLVPDRPWSISQAFARCGQRPGDTSYILGAIASACATLEQDASWVPVGPSHTEFVRGLTDMARILHQYYTPPTVWHPFRQN